MDSKDGVAESVRKVVGSLNSVDLLRVVKGEGDYVLHGNIPIKEGRVVLPHCPKHVRTYIDGWHYSNWDGNNEVRLEGNSER